MVNANLRQRPISAAVCVLIGYAKGKWLAKSITVKINLFPDTVHGVNGPTMSTAILEKMLPTIHSFIHIEHLYSASSRKLFRSAPNTSTVKQSSLKGRKKTRLKGFYSKCEVIQLIKTSM